MRRILTKYIWKWTWTNLDIVWGIWWHPTDGNLDTWINFKNYKYVHVQFELLQLSILFVYLFIENIMVTMVLDHKTWWQFQIFSVSLSCYKLQLNSLMVENTSNWNRKLVNTPTIATMFWYTYFYTPYSDSDYFIVLCDSHLKFSIHY